MEEKINDMDNLDEVMLPGFRFHPTDEELVDFYLKRKIQQKSLPIELIKQVDIYKYDPWDLPKMASSGEKEWYFYCPRDRKYRNSARPNRVTRYGFWKATGADRPIYSSAGKCIGLKKSLVFYRGRASNGIKTDWMMHEFRLPPMSDSAPPKKQLNKSLTATDSWAICRIFKKTNSMSMAQKALSPPRIITQLPESMVSDILTQDANCNQFSAENISCATEIGSATAQSCGNKQESHQVSDASANFSASEIPSHKHINCSRVSMSSQIPVSNGDLDDNFLFSVLESTGPAKCTFDASSALFNPEFVGFEGPNQQFSGISISLPQEMHANMDIEIGAEDQGLSKNSGPMQLNQREAGRTIEFPFSLSPNDAWRYTLPWDSPLFPGEISTSYFH